MADRLHFVVPPLEQAGYRAQLHASVDDFARDFRNEDVAAVFIDVHIGDGDATDVLDLLKQAECRAPLYLVSGDANGMLNARRYAEEIGLTIKETMPKPFTGKQLVERIHRKAGAFKELFDQIDIAEAVANGWIYPVLQPKLDLTSGRIKSAELLSRMAHPDFGVVAPQTFIRQMTSDQSLTLFLQNVGFFVRNFEYDPRRGNDFKININVDAKSLVAAGDRIKALVKTSPHIFRNLVFEITEETLSEISNAQLKVLYKLSLIGAQFSIDDFGAGLSNFARLSRLPFCEIKIDRSIVHGCSTVQARRIMVKSIVNMAHDMGVKAVAEGVETIDDFSFVEEVKCDEAQGYLIGRPMKLDKFRSFTEEFNGNQKDRRAGLATPALP